MCDRAFYRFSRDNILVKNPNKIDCKLIIETVRLVTRILIDILNSMFPKPEPAQLEPRTTIGIREQMNTSDAHTRVFSKVKTLKNDLTEGSSGKIP
jgi:hypothetical protein